MNSRVVHLMDRLSSGAYHFDKSCDLHSSAIKLVNTPIPSQLFQELAAMSDVYRRDTDCLAGDLLTAAVEDALDHLSLGEKNHLDGMIRAQEFKDAERVKKNCEFDAGAS